MERRIPERPRHRYPHGTATASSSGILPQASADRGGAADGTRVDSATSGDIRWFAMLLRRIGLLLATSIEDRYPDIRQSGRCPHCSGALTDRH